MENRPRRPQGTHPEIARLFAGTADRPRPRPWVNLELCVEPDSPAEAERLQVVAMALDAIWSWARVTSTPG
jgi:hypothetical protein